MKKLPLLLLLIAPLLFQCVSSSAFAREAYVDNFNSGKAKNWWEFGSCNNPTIPAHWWVDTDFLVQDYGCDGARAFIEGSQFSDQAIEANIKLNPISGGAALVFWYYDDGNMVAAGFRNGAIVTDERINGVCNAIVYPYPYNINHDRWMNFKIVVDGDAGELSVFADGEYQFTRQLTTPNRLGKTGLMTANAGAKFDNFKVKSHYPKPVY